MTSETSGRKPRPLQGLQVLELADEMGVYAGKLLADAGARVIKVEPPGGSAMRHRGPYLNDDPGPDRSLYFAFYNTGKESVTLDLGDEDDREVARRLASQADVVIDGMGLGLLASVGLSYEALRGDNPGLIWLQITPFGPEGPWASYKTSDLVALALGGPLFDCGYDDHTIPPIRGGGNQGYAIVSNLAMCAVMVALLWRQQSGEGQHIDLSMHDACATTVEFSNLYYFYNQINIFRQTCRHAAPVWTAPAHLLCSDGRYVWGFMRFIDPKIWGGIKAWLDEKGLLLEFAEPEWDDPAYRMKNASQIQQRLEALAGVSTAEEYYHRAQSLGVMMGVIRYPEDLAENAHLRVRGFWEELELPAGDKPVRFPGAPYRFTHMEARPGRPPALGEHSEAVRAEVGAT